MVAGPAGPAGPPVGGRHRATVASPMITSQPVFTHGRPGRAFRMSISTPILELMFERWHAGGMPGGMPSRHESRGLPPSLQRPIPPSEWPPERRTGRRVGADRPDEALHVGRHCWVVDWPLAPPGRHPGVLVEWRRDARGWFGRTAVVIPGESGPILLEAWLPADRLRPLP
jgi:hypothetical protein